ncbi:hypothetical protein BH20CHL6_BH20CHL6_07420 [soil metagenome]
MLAIAYVSTDREDDDGAWWAATAGQGLMQFVVDLAKLVRYLPSPKQR